MTFQVFLWVDVISEAGEVLSAQRAGGVEHDGHIMALGKDSN